jgi:NAD(P)-dependent dehydrogenase (short-subunit alcohol dehydrogenase family)
MHHPKKFPSTVPSLKMSAHSLVGSNILDEFAVKGKNVVVTGAARGLGLNFAQALAQAGANVAGIDLADQPSDGFSGLAALGGKYRYYKADVTQYSGLKQTIDQISQDFGSVDGW